MAGKVFFDQWFDWVEKPWTPSSLSRYQDTCRSCYPFSFLCGVPSSFHIAGSDSTCFILSGGHDRQAYRACVRVIVVSRIPAHAPEARVLLWRQPQVEPLNLVKTVTNVLLAFAAVSGNPRQGFSILNPLRLEAGDSRLGRASLTREAKGLSPLAPIGAAQGGLSVAYCSGVSLR
jgi:hypothetical protein